jgi:hypothetical protein
MTKTHAAQVSAPRAPLYPIVQSATELDGDDLLFSFGRLFVRRGGRWLIVDAF